MVKKKCNVGYGCGNTCITRKSSCRATSSPEAKQAILNYVSLVKLANKVITSQFVQDQIDQEKELVKRLDIKGDRESNPLLKNYNSDIKKIDKGEAREAIDDLAIKGYEEFKEDIDNMSEVVKDHLSVQKDLKLNPNNPTLINSAKKLEGILETQMSNLRSKFYKIDEGEARRLLKGKTDRLSPQTMEAAVEFTRMTNGKAATGLKKIKERKRLSTPGASGLANTKKKEVEVLRGGRPSTTYHELNHVLESNERELAAFSANYLRARMEDEEFVPIFNNRDMVGIKSNQLANAYQGRVDYKTESSKILPGNRFKPTEVASVFSEAFISVPAMVRALSNDAPGFAAYLAVIREL